MKTVALAAAMIAAVSASATAFAAPPTAAKHHASLTSAAQHVLDSKFTSGSVKGYAGDTRMLSLGLKGDYKLAPSITDTKFTPGEKVTVRWSMKDGQKIADQVKVN